MFKFILIWFKLGNCVVFNKDMCFGKKFYRFVVEDYKKGCFFCFWIFFFMLRKVVYWIKNRGKECFSWEKGMFFLILKWFIFYLIVLNFLCNSWFVIIEKIKVESWKNGKIEL